MVVFKEHETRLIADKVLSSIKFDCDKLKKSNKITDVKECVMNQVRGLNSFDDVAETREIFRREIEPITKHLTKYM